MLNRFQNVYKNPADALISINGTHFVLVNSMTMEGDQCKLCKTAERNILNISKSLECSRSRNSSEPENQSCRNEKNTIKGGYSRPILLQVMIIK